MSAAAPVPVRLWLELSHHAAFAVGGWAWVRADAGQVTGQAGGERRVGHERAALLALKAAVEPLRGRSVELHTASAGLAAIPARLGEAESGQDPPTADLDLWAWAASALKAGPVRIVRVQSTPATPAAFAAAWAELARDRAKDRGPFSSPIPKSNLAKAGV